VHQVPLSMKHVATGDRNAYDRCIFHVFDHEGRALLILGLGVYPNVGVIDAYATLRTGHTLHAVRASDALGDDRMHLAVGPLRIEVEEPLRRLRLRCDDDSLSYDLTWTAEFPALWEPHHVQYPRRPAHPRRAPLRPGGRRGGRDPLRRRGVRCVGRRLDRHP